MKKIEAYIKNHRLNEVIERLHILDGLSGVSIHEIKGFGRTRGQDESIRIVDNAINWVSHVKLEIFCSEEIKDQVINAIMEQLRGHIDIVITDSVGKTIREVSVKPYANNRPGIGTLYTIGFPFKTSIALGTEYKAKDLRVKLALHRNADKKNIAFDCNATLNF